jgi:hypothetical protein
MRGGPNYLKVILSSLLQYFVGLCSCPYFRRAFRWNPYYLLVYLWKAFGGALYLRSESYST